MTSAGEQTAVCFVNIILRVKCMIGDILVATVPDKVLAAV